MKYKLEDRVKDYKAEKDKRYQANYGFYKELAIKALRSNQLLLNRLRQDGIPWRGIQECLKEELPEHLNDRNQKAYQLVPKVMDAIFGKQKTGWDTEERPSKSTNGLTTWIVIIEADLSQKSWAEDLKSKLRLLAVQYK